MKEFAVCRQRFRGGSERDGRVVDRQLRDAPGQALGPLEGRSDGLAAQRRMGSCSDHGKDDALALTVFTGRLLRVPS